MMTLPLVLTTSRIFLAPLFAWTFIHSFCSGHPVFWLWTAALSLLVSELTDAFDGVVARRRDQVTNFGKVFDPMADSIANLTAFLAFVVVGIIPWWLFVVFLIRDSLMSLLRIAAATYGTVQAARTSGKAKAIVQAVAIGCVLLVCLSWAYGLTLIPRSLAGFHPGFWIMLVPAVVTVVSIFDYYHPNRAALREMMRTPADRR